MPKYFRIDSAFAKTLSYFKPTALALCLVGSFLASQSYAACDMENLDRDVVAVAQSSGVFISWRWLGDESDNVGSNVYRNGTLLNSSPLTDRTMIAKWDYQRSSSIRRLTAYHWDVASNNSTKSTWKVVEPTFTDVLVGLTPNQ